jgi:hypothetical protein
MLGSATTTPTTGSSGRSPLNCSSHHPISGDAANLTRRAVPPLPFHTGAPLGRWNVAAYTRPRLGPPLAHRAHLPRAIYKLCINALPVIWHVDLSYRAIQMLTKIGEKWGLWGFSLHSTVFPRATAVIAPLAALRARNFTHHQLRVLTVLRPAPWVPRLQLRLPPPAHASQESRPVTSSSLFPSPPFSTRLTKGNAITGLTMICF